MKNHFFLLPLLAVFCLGSDAFAANENNKSHCPSTAVFASGYSEAAKYQNPVLTTGTPLSADGGIFLKPQPDATTAQKLKAGNSPTVTGIGKIWNIAEFKTPHPPVEIGPVTNPAEFTAPSVNPIRISDVPICMAGNPNDIRIPKELTPYLPQIQQALNAAHGMVPPEVLAKYNVYVTVDEGPVEAGKFQRRPGAHTDGFQGFSIPEKTPVNFSFLASTLTPTRFFAHPFDFSKLVEGKHDFFKEMDRQAQTGQSVLTKPGVMYLMDGYGVHQAEPAQQSGVRKFIRISFDVEKFNRVGNAHNPLFDYNWPMVEKPRPKLEEYKPE